MPYGQISLRACYGMPGTNIAYGPRLGSSLQLVMGQVWSYARVHVSGAFQVRGPYARGQTAGSSRGLCEYRIGLRACYAMSGAAIACAARVLPDVRVWYYQDIDAPSEFNGSLLFVDYRYHATRLLRDVRYCVWWCARYAMSGNEIPDGAPSPVALHRTSLCTAGSTLLSAYALATPLSCYAFPRRCPVLRRAMVLPGEAVGTEGRPRQVSPYALPMRYWRAIWCSQPMRVLYAIPCTDIPSGGISLRASYAMSGTDIA
eukprot:303485-Rhodomonas_salina.1